MTPPPASRLPLTMPAIRHNINFTVEDRERETLASWTAPANAKCGDMCLLHETSKGGGRAAWVAFGRLCTDAVWAYQSSEKPRRHWAWIQWRQVRHPVSDEVAKREFGVHAVQGSHSVLPDETFSRFANRLVKGDPVSRKVLRRWQDPLRGYPPTWELSIHDLLSRRLDEPEHETALYGQIEDLLFERGWRELPEELDNALRSLRGPTPTDAEGDRRRAPDILLCRPRKKILLVVEVKRRAIPTLNDRDPVKQVLSYVKALRRRLRETRLTEWQVVPLLVAEEFAESVREDARRAQVPGGRPGIDCLTLDGDELISD